MQKINDFKSLSINNDELDLMQLFRILFNGKWYIVIVTSLVSFFVLLFSLSLPNIYQSKALIVPVQSSKNISDSLNNYSGLASLAGINLPSQNNQNNSIEAMHKLNSLSFFEDNVLPNIFLPDLMALKSWDNQTNKLSYDEEIFNESDNSWIRDFSYPGTRIPTAQESYKKFHEKHFSFSEDTKTGFITLSIKHQSPNIAKEWSELIFREINSFYRQKDKLNSEQSAEFLISKIAMTNISEIKEAMAALLQQEIQKLTLIEVNQSYVFDYLDPPQIMEQKSEPNRTLILILGILLGCISGILIVLIKHYGFREVNL